MNSSDRITGQVTWVYTENPEASFAFYENVLGLAPDKCRPTARIYRSAPGAFVGVCKVFGDRIVEPAGSMLTFVTDDVDGWYERLTAAGADVAGPPHVLERFSIYTFFARDPNGYVIEFQSFLEGD
ncbi:MAG: VOC family protein [Pseudomonadota bacterium]